MKNINQDGPKTASATVESGDVIEVIELEDDELNTFDSLAMCSDPEGPRAANRRRAAERS